MERNTKRFIFVLFALSFLVRLVFILTLDNHLYFDDEHEYLKVIHNFLSGNGLAVSAYRKSFRPPLFSLFLVIMNCLKFNLLAMRITQAIISSFTTIFIYFIGKNVFSERVGRYSGYISCFYPFFIYYTGFLLTETLFIFLVVVTMHYLIKLVDTKIRRSDCVKTGICFGLAALCRPTIEIFLPVSLLQIFLLKQKMQIKLKKILIVFILFTITLSPWIIRNFVIFHKFVPGTTMGGWVFWEGNNPESDGGPCHYFPEKIGEIEETKRDKILYKMTFEVIRNNPQRFRWLLMNKFKRFWNVIPNAAQYSTPLNRLLSVFSFGIMLPFFILGFALSLRNKKAQFFHSLIILFTVVHMIFLASIRYRVAIEPFYIILAVYGFLWISGETSGIMRNRRVLKHRKYNQ